MARWHEALRTYRRGPVHEDAQSDVMFVLCSENYAAAELASACAPAMVLQTFGGIGDCADSTVRATLEYAVKVRRVRRILVCGHSGCEAVTAPEGVDARTATQSDVVSQCERLKRDARLGALLRESGVSLTPIWFDDREGDVYACDLEGRPARLLSDDDFGRLVASLREHAT